MSGPRREYQAETPATIYFEVAPDPDDRVIAARWQRLPESRKPVITRRAALSAVPKALDTLKLKGQLEDVAGGYHGETNPGLALQVADGSRALELARFLGHIFKQQGMVVMSERPQSGLELQDVIVIHFPLSSLPET